jgi:hypothetical protein
VQSSPNNKHPAYAARKIRCCGSRHAAALRDLIVFCTAFNLFERGANPQEHLNSALHLGPVEGSMNTIEASFERSN